MGFIRIYSLCSSVFISKDKVKFMKKRNHMTDTAMFCVEKGTVEDIAEVMEKEFHITYAQAEECIHFLIENMDELGDNEVISAYNGTGEYGAEFMTDSMTYYVNIRRLTVCFLASLSGAASKDFMSMLDNLLQAVWFGNKIVVDLQHYPEARCVTLEISRHRWHGVTQKELLGLFCSTTSECIRNQLKDCHREDGFCCLTEEKLKMTLEMLENDGIIKKKIKGMNIWYYYQL